MKQRAMKRAPNQVPASLKTINLKAILRKQGIYTKQRLNKDMKAAALPLARKMLADKQAGIVTAPEPQKFAHFSNDEALAYWEKQIHIVDVMEARFEKKVEQFVNKMVNSFLDNLGHEITNKGYFDDSEDDLLASAQLDFTPLLNDVAILAGQEAMHLTGSKDIYTPYELHKKIAKNVEKFTKSMIETDRAKLTDIIENGLRDGQSVPQISASIRDSFDTYSKSQAERVTRTEVLRASTDATLDAYKQSGVVEGKQWLTAGADDECADYEGEIESLDGNFYDDTTDFADGDPPLHPNCRCVLLPVLIGEKGYQIDLKASNKALVDKIKDLESQIDKRTKAYRDLQDQRQAEKADDTVYIKALEKYLSVKPDTKLVIDET